MIAPENPPLRIAKSTSSRLSLRTSKFGPLVRSPDATCPVGLDPRASAASRVWQPPQRSWKSWAPRWRLVWLLAGASLVPSLQPENTAARTASEQARIREGRRTAAHIIGARMSRAVTVVAAVALAGCGGGDSGGDATTVPAGGKITVSAKEYSFTPKTIVAGAG